MKKSLITLSIILGCIVVHGQTKSKLEINFNEIAYGLTSAVVLAKQELETSPSQSHLTMGFDANLTKQTDSIPAKIGTQFAIIYKLESNKDKLIPVTIVWKYPEGMKDNKGKELTETRYGIRKETNIEEYSNYTLEGENELAIGVWTFQMYYGNNLLYERDFYLY
jgi:hypothetical protein